MKHLRRHLTYANVGVTACLLIVALALTPLGTVSANAADDLSTQVAKALKKSKAADKRSKQALKTAQSALEQGGPRGPAGPQGLQGLQGPPGADGSPDTAAQVLTKLLTVDGASSGLDADSIDGLDATAFARSTSFRAGLVQLDGSLTLNTTGVTASRNSVGDYRVDFGDLNSTCQMAVSVEEQFTFNRIRFIGSSQGWDVEIVNMAGTPVDAIFDFIAICRNASNAPARPSVR